MVCQEKGEQEENGRQQKVETLVCPEMHVMYNINMAEINPGVKPKRMG